MGYSKKPESLRSGSRLHKFLSETRTGLYEEEIDSSIKNDTFYPSMRHGLIKKARTGRLSLTKDGRELLKTAV